MHTHGCLLAIILPPLPPSRLPFDQNQALTSFKTPPSPHRIFDFQDSLDKLMHFLPHSCQILSPSETGYIVFAHRLPNIITLLTLIATL